MAFVILFRLFVSGWSTIAFWQPSVIICNLYGRTSSLALPSPRTLKPSLPKQTSCEGHSSFHQPLRLFCQCFIHSKTKSEYSSFIATAKNKWIQLNSFMLPRLKVFARYSAVPDDSCSKGHIVLEL